MKTWAYRRAAAGLLVILLLAIPMGGLAAAPDRQTNLLQMFTPPIHSTLSDDVPEEQFQFRLNEGQIYSLQLQLVEPTLQADLLVTNGQQVVSGEPVAGMSGWITAGPLIAPVTGDYSVTVRRVENTSGAYMLRLMPGYPLLEHWDTFDLPPTPGGLQWASKDTESSTIQVTDKRMRMEIHGANVLGNIEPENSRDWTDFYAEADVEVEGSPTYFEYGFLFHMTADFSEVYAATISNYGDWAVIHYTTDEFRVIQDWTVSPAIDVTDTTPRIGLYVEGSTFTLFFNGELVGSVTDPQAALPQGAIGLVAATAEGQKDTLTVYYDNLLLSVPVSDAQFATVIEPESDMAALIEGTPAVGVAPSPTASIPFGLGSSTKVPAATSTPIPAPTKPPAPTIAPPPSAEGVIESWASDNPADIVAELQSSGLIPSGGSMGLDVPVSYGETSSAGYSYFPLGQGSTFRNFVLAFDAHLDNTGPMSGCGMHFRDTSELSGVYSSSSALVTEDGYAFLAQFDSDGNLHPASALETSDAINPGQGAWNRVIVVANEDDVRMYVNGELLASVSFEVYTGNVALEMYVSTDDNGNTAYTYCQLDNIWLWEF